MDHKIFTGCIPALMTPCKADRTPDFDALVKRGKELIAEGMSAIVYCGSMGDWPLLSDEQRQEGVARLVDAGIPTIAGRSRTSTRLPLLHLFGAKRPTVQFRAVERPDCRTRIGDASRY